MFGTKYFWRPNIFWESNIFWMLNIFWDQIINIFWRSYNFLGPNVFREIFVWYLWRKEDLEKPKKIQKIWKEGRRETNLGDLLSLFFFYIHPISKYQLSPNSMLNLKWAIFWKQLHKYKYKAVILLYLTLKVCVAFFVLLFCKKKA